ncbi:MAG: hypothetical protein Q8Q89_01730, partial [bacterium]|nr:hypothetical protein [bacterium]
AKKTGGALTDAAMGAASKVGGLALGAATGGAGLAVGAAARAAAPQIKGAVEAVSRVPVLNKVLAPATRRVSGYVEEQQKVVEKRREGLKGQSDDMLVQHMRTSILAQDKVAAALELISRGSQARIKESGIDFKDLAEWGGRYGKGTADTIKNASYDLTPKKKYDGVANEMVAKDALDRNAKAFDRIAAVLELLKRPGQLNKATEQGLDMREIIRLATGFGNKPVEAILQSRPDLASPALGPEFTLEKIATKIKPDEINVQYDSMIRDMTTQGRSPAEIDNTLQRILQAVIVNGGSTERLGKMFSGLQGQSKDARNKVLTQVQLTLDNKPFWDSLESPTTGDPESFKRHVKYFVGRGVPAGLKTPTHLKDSAKRLGIKGGTP